MLRVIHLSIRFKLWLLPLFLINFALVYEYLKLPLFWDEVVYANPLLNPKEVFLNWYKLPWEFNGHSPLFALSAYLFSFLIGINSFSLHLFCFFISLFLIWKISFEEDYGPLAAAVLMSSPLLFIHSWHFIPNYLLAMLIYWTFINLKKAKNIWLLCLVGPLVRESYLAIVSWTLFINKNKKNFITQLSLGLILLLLLYLIYALSTGQVVSNAGLVRDVLYNNKIATIIGSAKIFLATSFVYSILAFKNFISKNDNDYKSLGLMSLLFLLFFPILGALNQRDQIIPSVFLVLMALRYERRTIILILLFCLNLVVINNPPSIITGHKIRAKRVKTLKKMGEITKNNLVVATDSFFTLQGFKSPQWGYRSKKALLTKDLTQSEFLILTELEGKKFHQPEGYDLLLNEEGVYLLKLK